MRSGVRTSFEIVLGLDDGAETLARAVARQARLAQAREGIDFFVLRRGIDARGGRVRVRVQVALGAPPPPPRHVPAEVDRRSGPRVVVVGSGPAGQFCALALARAGLAPTLLERGGALQPRRRGVASLMQRGALDPDNNYCFGEGGAGTFSDGKLYTRVKDRDAVREVLETLVEMGAPPAILVDARPHVGSNLLPRVLARLNASLGALGADVRFGAAVASLAVDRGRVRGVRLRSGEEIDADAVVLATGHSARDVYEHLAAIGVALEPKPLAVGVRIEHPQPLVDRAQYGAAAGHPNLPPAAYSLSTEAAGRGVYSFCMCPGGFVVNSSTEPSRVATNGMSLSWRDSKWANAGLVVTVGPRDFPGGHGGHGALGGLALQRECEERAFSEGGGGFVAPAQRAADFLAGRVSSDLPPSSFRPRLGAGDVAACLPPAVAAALREGLAQFDRRLRGFASSEALLIGVETRTSAPVRIVRDPETLESPTHAGLYPAAEGAGYAGGIVSAAIDGLRIASRILRSP